MTTSSFKNFLGAILESPIPYAAATIGTGAVSGVLAGLGMASMSDAVAAPPPRDLLPMLLFLAGIGGGMGGIPIIGARPEGDRYEHLEMPVTFTAMAAFFLGMVSPLIVHKITEQPAPIETVVQKDFLSVSNTPPCVLENQSKQCVLKSGETINITIENPPRNVLGRSMP